MLDERVFREEVRNLKSMIRNDPAVLARYDTDGNGEIDGAEWDRALELLRVELERTLGDPTSATRSAFATVRTEPAMDDRPSLANCPGIVVRQAVEHREVLMGYETCNRYGFHDASSGAEIGGAEESSGGVSGFLARQFLGPGRPLKLEMTDPGADIWMEGYRPFSILGCVKPPTLAVHTKEGLLGTVRRVWPLFVRRRYRISVANDFGPGLTIDGSVWRPWTFPVLKAGREVGTIQKKWSGGVRELFTDADSFLLRVEDRSLSAAERRLLVAAALAIDFDFFERDD